MVEDDFVTKKRELSTRFRQLRKGIPVAERTRIDHAICDRVVALSAYEDAALVLSYLSFGAEIDTHPLIERAWGDGKVVAIPRCVPGTRDMCWYRITSYEGRLVRSPIGVLEPNPGTFDEVDVTAFGSKSLALVPGLTFDMAGYRLGYGGGFYDVFLSSRQGTSVGLCREVQLLTDLREEGVIDFHDLAVDMVVTEARVIASGLRML